MSILHNSVINNPRLSGLTPSAILSIFCIWLTTILFSYAGDELHINVAMLSLLEKPRIPLSLIDQPIEDPAVPGAMMAIFENNGTGKFTGQIFNLEHHTVSEDKTLAKITDDLQMRSISLLVSDLPKNQLLNLSDRMGQNALIINVRAQDDDLRNRQCRANMLHTALSMAMKTDALAQYLVWKRWQHWMLVVGKHEEDRLYRKSIERAAKRFNGKIVEIKEWQFEPGSRRTDSGHVLAQQEVPVGTRGVEHDILFVADENDSFGEYLPYRTDLPRPVVGTQGMIATNWHRSHEQWGGTQLQRRFKKSSGRNMYPRDYSAWMAVRALGEAATKLKTSDHHQIRRFLLGEEFKLAAFKGVPLSFRNWNGQLRQPVLVVGSRMLVSVSPQKKFLHQFTALDTLGYDRPESTCTVF